MLLVFALVVAPGCSAPFSAAAGGSGVERLSSVDTSGDTSGDTSTGETAGRDDGFGEPCVEYGEPVQTGTVASASLDELSGIAVSQRNPGVIWVVEDHLAPNEVYAVDTSGVLLGTLILDGADNHDWEDLAVGPCGDVSCLFIGDIGDNDHDRTWHGILRVPEPYVPLTGGVQWTLTPDVFPYAFADGYHWDVEAMAVLPSGLPVLLSKEYDTEGTSVYPFETLDAASTALLTAVARVETGPDGDGAAAAVTSADLWPDGSRLIVRTYGHIWEFVVPEAGLSGLGDVVPTARVTGEERQGESIAYDPLTPGYVTVSEGLNPALYRVGCLAP